MKKQTASLALVAVVGLALAFLAVRHLIAPRKPPGGWYQGGTYTLTLQKAGGIAHTTREWIQISNQPPQTNHSGVGSVQMFVSGKSADEIAALLNRYDIDKWGHEVVGGDMIYMGAIVAYQGTNYHWSWNTSGRPPPSSLAERIKRMVIKPKHPLPHSREMHQLYKDILQVMQSNTNDLTIIMNRTPSASRPATNFTNTTP